LFNKQFGLRGKKKLTLYQIANALKRNSLSNGLPRCFQPGHIPKNKGVLQPVGTERIDEGYAEVKIARPNVWKLKHHIIWEAAHGPVPKGHVIMFADGNKRNFDQDNLLLVSRKELATMNRFGLIFPDKELTKAGKVVAEFKLLIGCREQEARKEA
jgi:hypothetical protein